jgi:uncharacterized protein YndB with AHSA1/START domain
MSAASNSRRRVHEPTTFSQSSPTERQVTRVFRAPVDRVFHLFTDPATLPYVMAPDPSTVTIELLEFRKGGKFSIRIKQDDGGSVRIHGEYREVNPPHRVVNTFEVDALPGFSALETDEFESEGDFTRLTVRWKYQRPEDVDKMAGPALERAVTAMWENVDDLLEKVVEESVVSEVAP